MCGGSWGWGLILSWVCCCISYSWDLGSLSRHFICMYAIGTKYGSFDILNLSLKLWFLVWVGIIITGTVSLVLNLGTHERPKFKPTHIHRNRQMNNMHRPTGTTLLNSLSNLPNYLGFQIFIKWSGFISIFSFVFLFLCTSLRSDTANAAHQIWLWFIAHISLFSPLPICSPLVMVMLG